METQTAMCRTQRWLRELRTSKSGASPAKVITDVSCRLGDSFSQGLKNMRPGPTLGDLPEEILRCIHSLVPVQDAARVACVSRGFSRSWRSYPSLIFNNQTLGLHKRWPDMDELDDIESCVVSKIDHILKNHSGIGIKVLKLELFGCPNIKASDLNRWFEFIIKPGIEELTLRMPSYNEKAEYNFPCSLLSNNTGGTLKSLCLSVCHFHPTVTLGWNISLTSLDLWSVHISGEELGKFVSSCPALEQSRYLAQCKDIICFKVPCPMQQLYSLKVTMCLMLQVMEINAPKLSTLMYGPTPMQISFGDASQVKALHIVGFGQYNMVCYARTELPSIMPNVETLKVSSFIEAISTPMIHSKFLRLKYLELFIASRGRTYCYDFLSLVSFLDASPALETFILRVEQDGVRPDSILRDSDGDQSYFRRIPECRHDNLKDVTIIGFNSAKSMIELTYHILESVSSLKCITLDTVCSDEEIIAQVGQCMPLSDAHFMEAEWALEAIRRYIERKIPSSVSLKVLKPCSQCHTEDW